jgi:hypothetical protein
MYQSKAEGLPLLQLCWCCYLVVQLLHSLPDSSSSQVRLEGLPNIQQLILALYLRLDQRPKRASKKKLSRSKENYDESLQRTSKGRSMRVSESRARRRDPSAFPGGSITEKELKHVSRRASLRSRTSRPFQRR